MKKLLKHSDYEMDSNKKLITTALFIAIAVLGSTFSFPILGAKCAPVQHVINVLSVIFDSQCIRNGNTICFSWQYVWGFISRAFI